MWDFNADDLLETTSLQDSYLAGLIDGEGTVCLFKSKTIDKGCITPRVRPILAIYNSHSGVLAWVFERYGGRMDPVKRAKIDHKPCYVWVTGYQHAARILRRCMPYLIIKKEQARLFIEYCETCKRRGSSVMPAHIRSRRDEIVKEVIFLNKRGASDAMDTG